MVCRLRSRRKERPTLQSECVIEQRDVVPYSQEVLAPSHLRTPGLQAVLACPSSHEATPLVLLSRDVDEEKNLLFASTPTLWS